MSTVSSEKKLGKNALIPYQLTKEHRPEMDEEYQRIINSGGRVQKLINTNGNLKGPFRVWEAARNTPGLTIARSLGNPNCKHIGISSDPGEYNGIISTENDYFLVIASDGVWDVMDNQEVTNFVEAYRESCVKGIDVIPEDDEVSFYNACIAQLLCEEARARWIMKIEDDDAAMDDISCAIIEFKQPSPNIEVIHDAAVTGSNMEEMKEREMRTAATIINNSPLKAPTIKEPRRSSVVGVSIYNSKTEML